MKAKKSVARIILSSLIKSTLLTLSIIIIIPIGVLFSLVPPLILADIVDSISQNLSVSAFYALAYFLALSFALLLDSAREAMLIAYSQKLVHSLRSELIAKIRLLSIETLKSEEPGKRAALLECDTENVDTLFTNGVLSMATDALKVIGIFFVIIRKNTGLAIMLLLILPFIFLYTRHIQKRMKFSQLENRKAIAKASGFIPEAIRNIRTVKNLIAEKFITDKYGSSIDESYKWKEKNNFYDSVFSPVISIITAIVTATVMILAASGSDHVMAFFGMSVGTSIAVISYISQIFTPIENIGMEIQSIQEALAGAKRINDFLALKERSIPTEKLSPSDLSRKALMVSDLSFGYLPEKPILENLSFSIEKGEHVTFMGRTGAGKSTLFKLILGEYEPQRGSIKVFGKEACEIADSEKRRLFGYVEQSFRAVPGTIIDQITLYDPSISDDDVNKALRTVGLEKEIAALEKGLYTQISPDILSHGEWQLLSIARAIAANPPILLLDEITASLDAATEDMVIKVLDKAGENRTVLSISHRLYLAKGGRCIEIGKKQHIQ